MTPTDKSVMIEHSLMARGIQDESVLDAFRVIPRELFIPPESRDLAYVDHPLPIGKGQTISQPYIVAYMLQELELEPHHRVLEVGSGSGYVIALLSRLSNAVVGSEIMQDLALRSQEVLGKLRRDSVIPDNQTIIHTHRLGAPDLGPYDRILVSAAASVFPSELFDQLAEGGVMVIPLGTHDQWLAKIRKVHGVPVREELLPVRFVPLL